MHDVPIYYLINLVLLLLTLKISLSAGYRPWNSSLKIIICFLSTVEKFRRIALQMQELIVTKTISCSEISQENVHGWAEF